jgi:hypothetical protein
MSECSLANDDSPLRQGDIFVWTEQIQEGPWRKFGIVITADCDLEQQKTKGQLSYLPVLTFEDYLWSFWRVEKFVPVHDKLKKKAVDLLNKVLTRLKPDQKPISEAAALAWISRTESADLAEQVGLKDVGQIKDFCAAIENYRIVERLLGTNNPNMNLLNQCHAINKNSTMHTNYTELSRDVQGKIASLPGDVFFMSGIEGFEKFGLFVMLRHITQCKIEDIAIRPDDLRRGGASARRIARVDSPYKFALAQNMARVFVDIGLPSSYADRQKNTPLKYFESLAATEENRT